MDAEFREFFGGPWNGEVRLCQTKYVQIPRVVPGESEFGQYEYVLDSESDMILRHGSEPND